MQEKREKLYKIVYNDIIRKIKDGTIGIGDKLPTTKELAGQYGVSVVTIENALHRLQKMNIVYSVRKGGTIVNGKKSQPSQKIIGCILPNSSPDCMAIFDSVCVTALLNNCFVKCMDTKNDPRKEREFLEEILSGDFSGVIIYAAYSTTNIELVSKIRIAGIPIVFVDTAIEGIPAPLVTSDAISGEKYLVDYLVSKGHRKIAFFEWGRNVTPAERLRFEGFCRALLENRIPVSDKFIYTPTRGNNFLKWYEGLEDKPTAVVCSNDIRASIVINLFRTKGYKIPEDLSVVGYDYSANYKGFSSYTTVKQNFKEIGQQAVKELFSGRDLNVSRLILSPVIFKEGLTVKDLSAGE